MRWCRSESQSVDLIGAGIETGLGRRIEGRTGCQDIVDEPNDLAGPKGASEMKCLPEVGPTLVIAKRCLRSGVAVADEKVVFDRNVEGVGDSAGDEIAVIEAAPAAAAGMECDGKNQIRPPPSPSGDISREFVG